MVSNVHCFRQGPWSERRQQQMDKIIEMVRRRYSDYQFTVERLANEVGSSLSQLRETVHFDYGMSPQELIETVRLEEAMKLLYGGPHKNLYEICASVGYVSLKTFLDAFKRRIGVTPTHWRTTVDASHDDSEEFGRCIEMLWGKKRLDENTR